MKTTIDMAREAGIFVANNVSMVVIVKDQLERFADLVRAEERNRAMRENAYVLAEREACAKVCDELVPDMSRTANDASVWDVATFDCAIAIRNRGNT
jgi:hypothetical protein